MMAPETTGEAGVVIAFDGSDASRAALEHAAGLFPGRSAVIATVWEPGLAQVMVAYDSLGSAAPPPDPRAVAESDSANREHAVQVARAGAELAVSLGLAAEPRAIEDDLDVADALIGLAEETSAAAIVVGTHGVTGLRSRVVGSVARKLLSHSRRPIVVIRDR